MYKLQACLFFVTVACGIAGIQDILESRQMGASIRNGLETLVVGAIFAVLLIASLAWKLRRPA